MDLKLLVLIIASFDPVYDAHWHAWQRSVAALPAWVDAYFLVADPGQAEAVTLHEDRRVVSVKTEENFIPGILVKTMESLRWFVSRQQQKYTHVLRTNMSSAWHWERMARDLARVPSDAPALAGIFATHETPWPMVAGSGMLMSWPAVRLLVEHADRLRMDLIDDVAISRLLCGELGLPVVEGWRRYDFVGSDLPAAETVVEAARDEHNYHWRVKGAGNRVAHDAWVRALLSLYA